VNDDELRPVIGKARMFRELRRAKERVRELEREFQIPFGRRSARDLAEWTSASRGPLAEPGD